MTRLTNHARDVFVAGVLKDIPQSIEKADEEARVLVLKWAKGRMGPKAAAAYKENPGWFNTEPIDMPGRLLNFHVPTDITWSDLNKLLKDDPLWGTLTQLSARKQAETDARDALRGKIRAAIYACHTVKQAAERLPEFIQYLPDQMVPVDRSVPVVANLAADLTAAGWQPAKAA